MLEIQKWLQENDNNFEKLKNDFGIKYKLYDDRVILKYSHIESLKFHPIVKECRGLILKYPDTQTILSRPFTRFYNYFEDPNSKFFDFSKSKITTKEDGSTINVYYDGFKMCAATSSTAFAEAEAPSGLQFIDILKKVNSNLFENIIKFIDPYIWTNSTFIFELCTKYNRVIKPYKNDVLYLIDIRNKNFGYFYDEILVNFIARMICVERPDRIKCNSYNDILKNIEKLSTLDEGYVCDIDGWKIKIKNPSYLAVHNLGENGSISKRRISKLVFLQDYEEYLTYFPEDKEFFEPYILAYDKMKKDIHDLWEKYKNIENKKEFALRIEDSPIKSVLFAKKNGVDENIFLENMTDTYKQFILEKYFEKE